MNLNEIATKSNLWELQQKLLGELREVKSLVVLLVSQGQDEPTHVLKAAYTGKELSHLFRRSLTTVQRWREEGLLNGIQPNGPRSHWIYPYSDNKDLIDARLKQLGEE